MENSGFPFPIRGRAALLATACLLSPLFAGELSEPSGLAAREASRRSASTQEAHQLLLKGDESYNAGRYADAVEAYAGARDMLPDAPNSAELRNAATERYAQASVQYGRDLARKGDIAGAKAAVDKVLQPSVAPNDPGARALRADLDDPIRTNPALTAEHAKNVDQVRQLLYTAEGAYNLGKYDQSKSLYEDVLRLDPYNSAARRGLERLAAAKSDYQRSAKDHTRAEMLGQVGGAWELPLTPLPVDPGLIAPLGNAGDPTFIPVSKKLERIIIPKVILEQASISDAVEFLRIKAAELGDDPLLGGVNFNLNLGDAEKAAQINAFKFDLQLSNTPLSQVLKYVTEMTKTSYSTDDFSVIIQPLGEGTGKMSSRAFKVPPGFLATLSEGASAPAAAADPFASAPASGGGLLAKRLGVQEAFAMQGVTFPDGASASLQGNLLRVTNTEGNLDLIARVVDSISENEPVNIITRVTILRTDQRNLDELGFDWALTGNPIGSHMNVAGGTQGNGGNLSDVLLNPLPAGAMGAMTAGNRSGGTAVTGNAIDDIVALGSDRNLAVERAPGIFRLSGVFKGNEASMLMRGLSQKKGVDLMTSPNTLTRSGQASSVRVVREFIYPTEYEPPEVPQTISSTEIYLNGVYVGSQGGNSFPVTPATPTAFETREVGVILEVLPTADPSKRYVEVVMKPSITDFDGFVNYGTPINMPSSGSLLPGSSGTIRVTDNAILMPVFSTQRVDIPTISVADGSTIIVGGLLQQSLQNVEDKTPVFGDLPVVGRLFQSKARQPMSTAIIFMVNVQIVDSTGRPFRQDHQ